MLFIVFALGVVGAFVIGLDGLMLGSAGELERIAAIACFALAAAGLVGVLADDRRGARNAARKPRRDRVEHGDVLHVIAVAPIMLLSIGVFLATLLPAMYVMLPFFAVWWFVSAERRPETTARAPAAGHPLHAPAYP